MIPLATQDLNRNEKSLGLSPTTCGKPKNTQSPTLELKWVGCLPSLNGRFMMVYGIGFTNLVSINQYISSGSQT